MDVEGVSRDGARGVALLAKVLEIALAEADLSPSQYRLLNFLLEAPAAATALADRLDVTRPSLTALVDGLVARGLVVREPDPDDRRRVSHQISDQGRAAAAKADAAIQQRLGQLLTNLEPGDQVVASTGLERWLDAILAARANKATP